MPITKAEVFDWFGQMGDLTMVLLEGNEVIGGPVRGYRADGKLYSSEPMQVTRSTSSPVILIYADNGLVQRVETAVVLSPGDTLALS